ncbi:beta-xylosidase/alpha-L-arabinofuranosidase 1-like [Durio zibethinus]|uniref:Beta-xylosidase/alpha-L-arabinofuranosidase 1-like n=1 Tax=Durio zibethinus TaxID=66656 RepID=A0A6P6A8X5_DURZI|nr:beta-xylosidase/alpha-L-arabinofuranosidase 1-like [Durio zibethinus]
MLGLDMASCAFCDKSLSYEVRAKDLVDRLTLIEKAQQMGDHNGTDITRLGLPKYMWWSEALHGVADVGPEGGGVSYFDSVVPGATSFPNVILTAASFNQTLWKILGKVVSTEARAMYNLGRAGLTFWSPNINIVRDPRWGRVLETPGEDPFVAGTYAVNYVRGLQDIEGQEKTSDPNSRPLKVSACCKHFTAYDLEDFNGITRLVFNAKVAEQDMVETFNLPFEMCVKEGDVSSVMCSFNQVNGIPTCADPYLLKKLVREDWNLHGYIVADCDSVLEMVVRQKWLNSTGEDASAYSLKAGLDLDCGEYYTRFLPNAVKQGKVREADMDKSLNYLFVVLMRLGFFDGIPSLASLGKADICTKENTELAAEAARQGIVLLKNDNEALPLDPERFKSIALIGPHANATEVMIGNYAGVPCKYISPIEGFSAFGQVTYEMGCVDVRCPNDSLIHSAVDVAKNAEATLLFVGLSLAIEREWVDRKDLLLPGYQTHLVNEVAQAAKGPVILVVMAAGVLDISFAKVNPKIQSIIWVGYPGEQGGRAIADVVFGNYNPGGRLPLTWYEANYIDKLPMTSMSLRPTDKYPGRTYKFFNGSTVYPFGYGLSYTSFKYQNNSTEKSLDIKLDRLQHCHGLPYKDGNQNHDCPSVSINDLSCKEEITFDITVQNVGKRDGSDVILVYTVPPEGISGTPIKQLVRFERVYLHANESKSVKFVLNVCKSLNIVNVSGYRLLPSGLHKIVVGDISIPIKVNYNW